MVRGALVSKVLGRTCQFAAASLLLPSAVALIYGEASAVDYASTAVAALVLGLVLQVSGRNASFADLSRREGFLVVVLSWLAMVGFGAVPFWYSGAIPSLVDALFESASGFSTTGATILYDIEALDHSHLFQRSLAHWIGGMGIIVLSVAILPELAVGGMQLFSAESSGISTDKLSPRIVSTARRLWWLYAGMTALLAVLLLVGGMTVFEAITHAFGTVATGGFSTRNASVGSFDSVYIELVLTLFMLASGVSFALLYRVVARRQYGVLFRSDEVRLYTAIFVFFTILMWASLVREGTYDDAALSLRAAVFQAAAILTTTGYGTADFDRWPDLCRYLLVLLMITGGCAGSTAGGVKVVRILVVIKHAGAELRRLVYPTAIYPVMVSGRVVTQETIRAMLGFFLLYITTIVVATALVLAMGLDLVSGVSAVVSAMNSIGPGLGVVGPAAGYAELPDGVKLVLSFCMIVGRLEIYTVFVLFTRSFWRN